MSNNMITFFEYSIKLRCTSFPSKFPQAASPERVIAMTPGEYAKQFLNQQRSPLPIRGVVGRFMRGILDSDFEMLSDEPNKKLSWICSSEVRE